MDYHKSLNVKLKMIFYKLIQLITPMIFYLFNKAKKIKQRNIKIDITEFDYHKRKITEEVKEVGISNIIYDFKHKMDNIPYNTIKILAEILILYDELEYFNQFSEPITENYIKKLNKKLKQVDFIPKKIKENIMNDFFKLFKIMTIPGNEINAVIPLIYYREIIMYYFLENENLKESLSMIKYYYIKKNNKFVKIQTYCNNDLEKGNYYQDIIYKILRFYYHNNLYCDYDNTADWLVNKREMKQPIIGYKNNIPVLNPKFFKFREKYSFFRQLLRNIGSLVTF